jgi:hypothetical protein
MRDDILHAAWSTALTDFVNGLIGGPLFWALYLAAVAVLVAELVRAL